MAKSERYSNLLPYHIIVAAASGGCGCDQYGVKAL